MPSGHSVKISIGILGCRNDASTSHISTTHPYSSWYKVRPIKILVDVFITTGENDFMYSTTRTCTYP